MTLIIISQKWCTLSLYNKEQRGQSATNILFRVPQSNRSNMGFELTTDFSFWVNCSFNNLLTIPSLTQKKPPRFTHFLLWKTPGKTVKAGKWELIRNKVSFSFTLLAGNRRGTRIVPDQCFWGQFSPEHVNVWSAALGRTPLMFLCH